ncbi:MAG: TIGR00725 family protein [Planctomycetes bacterium]|nr:TIGR00725 family protein [Planctomycetota bacterium]MBL7145255.1 TIGR00725 family protein [Phycisphaerae bacterium]
MKNNYRLKQITVIGDSDAPKETCDISYRIGKIIAELGYTLITGGRSGVMEYASQGAFENGGLTIGIIPSVELKDANKWCKVVIPTGIGHARNVLTILSADIVIAIGGAAGTLSEVCLAWIHNKQIITMSGYGGWSDKLGNSVLDHRRSEKIYECKNLEDLTKILEK